MSKKSSKTYFIELKAKADLALENNDFEAAHQLYSEAVRLDSDNAELYKCLGRVFYAQGQWEKAEKYYLHAIDKDNNHWASHHNLGVLFEDRGELEKAIEYYKKAANLDAKQIISCVCLADIYSQTKQYVLANYCIEQAYSRDPDDYRIFYSHANMLMSRGEDERGIVIFEKMIHNTPDIYLPQVYLCLIKACLPHENKRKQTIKYCHCFIQYTDTAAYKRWAYRNLVRLYEQEGDYQRAVECGYKVAEHLEEDTDEFDRLNEFADQFTSWKETPLLAFGIKALLEYAVAHPASSLVHYFLAFCFNTAEDYPKVVKHAKLSISLDPSHPRAYYQLAYAYHQLAYYGDGNYADCIATYKKIVEIDPFDYYEVYDRLADIYRRQGALKKADLAEKKGQKLKKLKASSIKSPTAPRIGEHL